MVRCRSFDIGRIDSTGRLQTTGAGANLGRGRSSDLTPDWTFLGNGGSYFSTRLWVYVREPK